MTTAMLWICKVVEMLVSSFARNAERNNLYPFRVRRNPEIGSAFTEIGSVPYQNRECADYLPMYTSSPTIWVILILFRIA